MKPCSLTAILLALITSLLSATSLAAAPTIVVTLKPIHSLVTGLCQGVCQPVLLLNGTQSPHDYTLKPSERRLFESASIIIYASSTIESFIEPLQASLSARQFIALDTLPGMPLLAARGTSHTHHQADYDGHTWLSPINAGVFVNQLADILAQRDPANREVYFRNRDQLLQKLRTLHVQIQQKLMPVHNQPFLQFHDALQYFERDFSLTHGLAVTSGAEHAPGARHIKTLQQQVREKNINCFLYEPPQAPKLLETLDVNHTAKKQALEIHGSELAAGADLYFVLLQNIATTVHRCLQK
jgi:zinc transport system substrate-binding protein